MREITGDKLRGHVASLILSSLENSEAHGLEIVKRIEAAGSGALNMKEGSLYPALYRLEKSGLITGRRGARRRLYQLTKKGKRQLQDARQDWAFFVSIMNPALGMQT
jgi:PadR family transcriptional regulator PadR